MRHHKHKQVRQSHATSGTSNIEIFLGIILGGFIGALLGMLLAPRTGEETRAQLAGGLHTLQDRVNKLLHEVRANGEELIKKA